MYCCHCGYKIDENKIECRRASQKIAEEQFDDNTEVQYICPRCGYIIHRDVSEQEMKTLCAASHAEIQRGRNLFSTGMSFTCIAVIVLILAIIFFKLAMKPANNYQLVTSCPEFFVSLVAFAIGAVCLGIGLYKDITGLRKKKQYEDLLKDIKDKVFNQ